MTAAQRDTAARWTRVAAAVLGIGYLVTGTWALVDPTGWARGYPGFGRHWLESRDAASPHLIADAGAGFAAVGVALVIAAVAGRRAVLALAAAVLLTHSATHFVHHLADPTPGLPTFDVVVGVWGLGLQAAVAAFALIRLAGPPTAEFRRRPRGETASVR